MSIDMNVQSQLQNTKPNLTLHDTTFWCVVTDNIQIYKQLKQMWDNSNYNSIRIDTYQPEDALIQTSCDYQILCLEHFHTLCALHLSNEHQIIQDNP